MSPDEQTEQLLEELEATNRGVVALTAELDERTRELEAASRRKNEFLAMLAHELRNPLAVIRLVLDDVSPEETADVLRRQVDHVRRLVDDLLDVSRVEQGKIALVRRPVDLGPIVGRAVADARRGLASKGQTLRWSSPEGVLTIDGDADRLKQMVSNLLDNASKYAPEGTSVLVRAFAESGEAVVEVHDEGRGLTADELSFVFELFAQGEGRTTESGLGIGLTLVRRLAALHGGRVEAQSDGRDRGSVFRLRLPLADPAAAPLPEPRKAGPGRLELRVLLVEDGDELRMLLAARLRRRGLTVHEAEDAEEALSMLPDLLVDGLDAIVSDLGLPGMSGYEFGCEVRAAYPDLPTLALSGYGAEDDRRRTREAGFAAHLVKPIELDQLMTELENTTR